uniref:Phenylalanine--tRNA ligase alpha subunit n=1 Tax=Magnetococcus massalia (strain MO-1) TaxID=451514 RepID=A0A1S7LLX6_MAGMO|nr:Phenylalanyl-tRNA synthetase alpha chain (Phenylalanine--tRNA ligase alpha chain) [Candidatus Magnetococcus massalia]
MREALEQIKQEALAAIEAADSLKGLDDVRVAYMGKKGSLTQQYGQLKSAPPEDRKALGAMINEVKVAVTDAHAARLEALKKAALQQRLESERVDISLPGRTPMAGGIHPVTRAIDEIATVFATMGFEVASGPEIESDWHNFEALNIPADHPAREMHDTFYISDHPKGGKRVLRTHTSPVQIRVMEDREPPLRVIAPGKVFRCDSDVTHTPMFHQVEGFMVDRDVHFGQLKGLLQAFLREFFERDLPVRFRPSFFPFTEPSAEVDMGCLFCDGKGCRICKGTGWLEVLGCGMIHPNVMKNVGFDSEKYSGFAFGMGVERLGMLKYGINDLRTFFENDVRFLSHHSVNG